MANSKLQLFQKRRLRVRNKLRKVNAGRVRLSVHRSNKNISVQLIDDVQGVTLASASTMEKDLGVVGNGANVEAAQKVGALIAERAKKAGVEEAYFDRGGFLFHGRVKALAPAVARGGAAGPAPASLLRRLVVSRFLARPRLAALLLRLALIVAFAFTHAASAKHCGACAPPLHVTWS